MSVGLWMARPTLHTFGLVNSNSRGGWRRVCVCVCVCLSVNKMSVRSSVRLSVLCVRVCEGTEAPNQRATAIAALECKTVQVEMHPTSGADGGRGVIQRRARQGHPPPNRRLAALIVQRCAFASSSRTCFALKLRDAHLWRRTH